MLGLRPMWPCPRIAGRVITVRLRRAEPGEHAPAPPGHRGHRGGRPGQVIVIEHHDRDDAAGWGGILSLAARIEGHRRRHRRRHRAATSTTAATPSFPVYARAATPMTARGRIVEASMGEPIRVGDLTCRARRLRDRRLERRGVRRRPTRAEEVIATAEALAAREAQMADAVRAGKSVVEVMGANYESMLGSDA